MTKRKDQNPAIKAMWAAYAKRPSKENRNALVLQYMYLVQYIAKSVWHRLPPGTGVDCGDLETSGAIGLMAAIEKFDQGRGVKFTTYCAQRIRGQILDDLRGGDWMPRLARTKQKKISKARETAANKLGRLPTDSEIADSMGMDVVKFERMQSENRVVGVASLSLKVFETNSHREISKGDSIKNDECQAPGSDLDRMEMMRDVTKGLNKRERLVIILYYYEGLTMKEIGKTIGLSESRVSQMHSHVLERIKERMSGQ
jgi:RNA polymerase sigma factor for flagellar operon FliA